MKYLICIVWVFCFSLKSFSQDSLIKKNKPQPQIFLNPKIRYTGQNKGKFFIYWGGNRGYFANSTINFKGSYQNKPYNFTLHDVKALERFKGWTIDFINPARLTIPQYNIRYGYFLNNHYAITIGVDHMKYVVVQNQQIPITGTYPNQYDSTVISNGRVDLTDESFLTYEHTDGLNYVNAEIERHDDFSSIFKIRNTDIIQFNFISGAGLGVLVPKTNSKLFGNNRYDEFHFAGYGLAIKLGLDITLFKHYFVRSEIKGGYINMPDIRTTEFSIDKASQEIYFLQTNIVFGAKFKL